MTTEEKIEVMKAYTEGKQIQFYVFNTDKTWKDISVEPEWDWNGCIYRIKPESTYRQYKSIEEMIKDINERRVAIQNPPFSGIWLKNKEYDIVVLITGMDNLDSDKPEILLGENWVTLTTAFNNYTYLDGTPFGIKE